MITTPARVGTPQQVRSQPDNAPGAAARLGEMPVGRFRLLVLAIVTAAAMMAAEGVQSFAELATRNAVFAARREAASPVPYRTLVPVLHAAVPAAAGTLRVLVRADSAGAGAEALCSLARAADPADIRWIALSPAVEPCLSGAVVAHPGPAAAREMADARWMFLDAHGAALHTDRSVPSADRLGTIAALLAPAAS